MSLFNDDQTTVAKFEDLVGEGKKYKDNDAAAKAIVEKDNFINRLKSELDEARREITARPAVDRTQEILDQLEALKNKPDTQRQPDLEPDRSEVKGLTADDVDRLLMQREARAKAERNISVVKEKLTEQFGDKYAEALKSIAEKNGLSAQQLDDLAAKSPQLVLNLVGTPTGERGVTPPNSTVQPGGFKPTADGHKTRSWWNELKAKDRNLYFSAEMQMKQYKDAMTLQEAFEDT